jgi:hypothetical protein
VLAQLYGTGCGISLAEHLVLLKEFVREAGVNLLLATNNYGPQTEQHWEGRNTHTTIDSANGPEVMCSGIDIARAQCRVADSQSRDSMALCSDDRDDCMQQGTLL